MAVLIQKARLSHNEVVTGTIRPRGVKPLPALQDLLRHLPAQLPGIAVLGICDDGVPLLLDLQNPRPGSLLILADDIQMGQHLLDVIRVSLVQQNRPHEVQILWGSERVAPRTSPLVKVVALHERETERTFLHLADIVESRQHGRLLGPILVLLLDDLNIALSVDREARWALEFLIRNGAQQGVWVIAAQDTASLTRNRVWLERFGTRIFGPISDLDLKDALLLPKFNEGLSSTKTFMVQSQGVWLQFSAPEI